MDLPDITDSEKGSIVLPNCYHIGAAKCASTWLYHACLEHPDIYSPPENDNLNFFLLHYDRGLDWYRSQYFGAVSEGKAIVDFSNAYMLSDIALDRIARDTPNARLTCLIRNPVDRAYLHWAHSYYKSSRPPADPATDSGNPLDAAVERPSGRTFAIPLEVVRHPNGWVWGRAWLEPGLYAAAIRRVQARFPEDRLRVFVYEDLLRSPEEFLSSYFEYLEVDPSFVPACINREINPDTEETDPARMTDDLRTQLKAFFRSDIEDLQRILDRDLSEWL
tara:strand:+ start:3853 stop:4683 length:831 start_codon:yes stop_codon:yes gene_type:complete